MAGEAVSLFNNKLGRHALKSEYFSIQEVITLKPSNGHLIVVKWYSCCLKGQKYMTKR